MTAPERPLRGLYAITRDSGGDSAALRRQVAAALRGGATLVQYRDKSGDAARRQREAADLAALCAEHGVPLIINDDVALAARVGAAGVHLGRDDPDIAEARAALGADALIGVSCYNEPARAEAALAAGADYLAFGSFYPSPTKPHAVRATPALLQRFRGRAPLCAIGGITLDNAAPLLAAGADLLAVISALWDAPDIAARAAAFAALWPDNERP